MAKDINKQLADKKFANDKKLADKMAKAIAKEKAQDEKDKRGW